MYNILYRISVGHGDMQSVSVYGTELSIVVTTLKLRSSYAEVTLMYNNLYRISVEHGNMQSVSVYENQINILITNYVHFTLNLRSTYAHVQ